jgi:ketosteroid isomerase-like protein
MSEKEPALNAMRRLIYALNAGDSTACLTGMSDNVVIVDDVAPFHRTGRQEAEQWLGRLADMRKRLHASLSLEAAEVRLDGNRAYIVAPGVLKGSLVESDFEMNGLVTSTLVERDGKWLVDSLIWSNAKEGSTFMATMGGKRT